METAPTPVSRADFIKEAPGLLFAEGQKAESAGMVAQAVACYQLSLKMNPSFGESIAALGRLRFIAPEQPYMNELRQHLQANVYEITIEVRNPCNYRCFYCVAKGQNNVPVQEFDFPKIKEFFERLKGNLIVTSLECAGGEPTVHPQFPELIRLVSSYGAVSFPSNNSQNPERWLPRETASRLVIRSSLHPEAEKTLDKYLKNARYLLDAGCHFTTTFVSHPTRIALIPEYRKRFAEANVPFTPVGFIGIHEGRKYPNQHTDEEKQAIGLEDEDRYWMHRTEPHMTRVRRFRGIPCLAGYQSFYLNNTGAIRRCSYDTKELEKPLDKAEPCEVRICGCGMMLEKLNSLNTGEFYNSWAGIAGVPPLALDMEALAKKHGYDNISDAMTKEQVMMYDALMEAYGKNEFRE